MGIAVITNDDIFGPLLKEVIKFRIADEALGLEPVDWDSRFVFFLFLQCTLPRMLESC